MPATSIGLIIFLVYLAAILVIGIISARYQKTSEDFWVGGRRFGVLVMVMANMAAIMHGGSILSGVAFAGQFGGVAILPYLSFTGGIAVIFFFFARKLRRSRGFTIPDYMGDRFDSRFLRAWSALVVALSSMIYLIAQIRGMGFILESLLGVPFLWGMVIGTAVFIAYVALGGLVAVVWTNILQFGFMWLGLILLAPGVYGAAGGWTELLEKVNQAAPGWTSPKGVVWSWSFLISWYVIWFVAYSTRLELVTKMFAARDDRVARFSLPWTILLVMLFLLYGNLYLGAAARVLVWDQISSPDSAFPTLVSLTAGPLLSAIVLTGIASAAMSTTDSLLLMSGAALAHDFLRKCLHEPRGAVRSEEYYLRVSRYTIVGVGALAFAGALPDFALILQIVSYAVAIVGATFFFPLIAGLTSRRISREAAIASSMGGCLVTVLWMVLNFSGIGWARAVHPGIPGLVAAGLLLLTVTPWTPAVTGPGISKFFEEQI